MTGASALALGFALGLRHAADADHLIALSTLLQREAGVGRAARVAAAWGVGHSAAFAGVALPVVLAGVHVPAAFERAAEALVASTLLGLGAWQVGRASPAPRAGAAPYARPLAVGVAHGLAGSAGVALLAATAVASRLWALGYLALFGFGTVLGMVGLTVAMARPIAWASRGRPTRGAWTARAAGLASVALGIAMLWWAAVGKP